MGWKLEVAPAGISREACLQQRLHLLSEIPADLGLCDTQNRGRIAAVSLLLHALDPTGQAGLPPVLNTSDRESAPTAASGRSLSGDENIRAHRRGARPD